MATSRDIINELRAQARTLRCFGYDPVVRESLMRSLHRGADEIDRLQGELDLLRAFAEIPEDTPAAPPASPARGSSVPASLARRYRDYVGEWPEDRA